MAESPPQLIKETVVGYEAFKKRIEELTAAHQKVVVLFTGSKTDDERRKSWCPDCNDLEDVFKSFKVKFKPQGFLLTVDVGNRDQWKSPTTPFRTDPKLKLTSIPTLLVWGTQKRLSHEAILNEENLAMLFEDDD